MRFKLFFAIGGENFDAQSFQQGANIHGSRTKRIGHLGQKFDPARFREWNVWESPRLEASNDPGDDILKLIADNACAISFLEGGRFEGVERWVGIVGYYIEGESPRGFSFDATTIGALAKIGASIEIDVVYETAEILKYQIP